MNFPVASMNRVVSVSGRSLPSAGPTWAILLPVDNNDRVRDRIAPLPVAQRPNS